VPVTPPARQRATEWAVGSDPGTYCAADGTAPTAPWTTLCCLFCLTKARDNRLTVDVDRGADTMISARSVNEPDRVDNE